MILSAAGLQEGRRLETLKEAESLLGRAWQIMADECRAVLGGELHYQAMAYHALRMAGVPLAQVGMNVKQWIAEPTSELFRQLSLRKPEAYQGGFEPIPDIVLFRPEIEGDWRRRNRDNTLRHMLMAIEVKASERASGRLSRAEVLRDIQKLSAHRHEVRRLGADMTPVMVVIDVAPLPSERMRAEDVAICQKTAEAEDVRWLYLG